MITEAGEFHPSLDFFGDGDDLLFPSHHHHHQEDTLLPDADDDVLLGTSTHSAPGGYFFPSIPENKELSLQPLSLLPHSYHHHHHPTDGFHSPGSQPGNNNNNINLSSSPSSALDFTTITTIITSTAGEGKEVVMNNGPSGGGGAPALSTSAATTPTASGSNSPMGTTTNNNTNHTNAASFMGGGDGFFNPHSGQPHMFMLCNQGGGVPRVSSMPNMRLNTHQYTTTMEHSIIPAPISNINTAPIAELSGLSKSGSAVDLRCQAAANRAMPRSQSAIELSKSGGIGGMPSPRGGGGKHFVPHQQFLTPSHLRKGKGGRQPAADPRLDPKIDPKKAKRILANRLSAARSKLKQKSQIEVLRQRVEGLKVHKEGLMQEVEEMGVVCAVEEQKRARLMQEVSQLEASLGMCTTTTTINVGGGANGGGALPV
jgi:hypothetical protein